MSETTRQGWTPGELGVFPAHRPGIEADTVSVVVYGEPDDRCGIHGNTPEEAQANAHRLVSCWNGCSGLADPGAVPDLVAALEAMLTLDNRDNGNQMADAITDMARAALARAKGTTTTTD